MTASLRVLTGFDTLTEAADALLHVRSFVLDLAVRGRLVAQDPEDESVDSLLERVRRRIEQVTKDAKGKRRKPEATPVAEDERAFEIPPSWRWVRLAEIAEYIQRGKSPTYSADGGVPVVSQKCVQWQGLDLGVARLVTVESLHKYEDYRFLRGNDLLWNSTGTGTIGRVIRVENPPDQLACDSHVTVVRCTGVDAEYVRAWLRSSSVYGEIEKRASGSTNQVELTAQMANDQPVPLPPLDEQQRIVARVDELMRVCDELDAAQQECEDNRDRLTVASSRRLREPEEDDAALLEHARFHLANLSTMTARPDQVPELRRTILSLAVRGKLVQQVLDDTSVDELLEDIDDQRSSIALTDRRASAKPQDVLSRESRWPIPASWAWRGLADLALFIDYRGKTPTKTDSGVPLITAKNVRRGRIDREPREFISDATYEVWMTRGLPSCGDVLLTTEAPLGNAAVVDIEDRFALAQRVINLRLYGDLVPAFVALQLLSPPFQEILAEAATGLTAKGIKAARLKRLPFAVPPLPEQRRIVAKADELMALCDELEESLMSAQVQRSRLLEAVLHEALERSTRGDT